VNRTRYAPFVVLLCVISGASAPAGGARTVAAARSARITTTAGDRSWSIGNERVTFLVDLDAESSFRCRALVPASSGRAIDLGSGADVHLTINGETLAFGSTAAGWEFVETRTDVGDSSVRAGFVFDLPRHRVRATRWFSVSAGSPTIEAWTVIEAAEAPVRLDGIHVWDVTVPAGDVDWLSGLQATEDSEPFTRKRVRLNAGDYLKLGAEGRSSEYTVPWFAVRHHDDVLYAGLMWSGAWGATLARDEDRMVIRAGLPATVTQVGVGAPLETPHLFFGASAATDAAVSWSLQAFLRDIRQGRGWDPLVTYNTWFAHGTRIDEDLISNELARNAAIGTELFVLDAGWYPGNPDDRFDFTTGLGRWTPDAARFPRGLGVLADEARRLGMQLGVWVEPERVDLAVVGDDGPAERWLARRDGLYDPNRPPEDTHAAQICLASAEARAWLLARLVPFIEEQRPAYLKWDNNFWVNCNREGHDHGHDDGNFRHVQGLYEMLGALRERFPTLIIENVSGGGNRLDFGMARLTDVGWMDDRTTPSVYVRHNLQGLLQVFPPAYLLSFVMGDPDEPLRESRDVRLFARSRMPGRMGLCFNGRELSPQVMEILTQETATYKSVRDVLRGAATSLLAPQTSGRGGGDWDAIQATSPDTKRSVLFAFQQNRDLDRATFTPVMLDPEQTYDVSTVDDGKVGTATGAQLMASGVGIQSSPRSAAHIVVFSPVAPSAAARVRR